MGNVWLWGVHPVNRNGELRILLGEPGKGYGTEASRLLETLPEPQKPAFQTLLDEAYKEKAEIQHELDELYRLLDTFSNRTA